MGFACHGDLPLLHGLQQGGLHLGRGPVDLIGQDQVVENGTAWKMNFSFDSG